jgi:hypothetical protein
MSESESAEGGQIGCLEALLSSKPIISEPVTVEHGDSKVTIKFRELSNDQKNANRMHAIQFVEDRRRTQEDDGKGEWRDADSDLDVLKAEETDLRMLHAAMMDPKTGGPACSLEWLRKRMGTGLQTKLGDRYAKFEAAIDPAQVTEEMIEGVIQDVRDNYPFDYLLMQYDSILLVRSLQFLVAQQSTLEIAKSSGTGTPAKRRSKKPKSSS